MDIDDAFTTEVINAAGTNVSGEEETELREVIRRVYDANQVEYKREDENVAVLCFVAGRAYERDLDGDFQITMSRELVAEFMEFLVQRRVS